MAISLPLLTTLCLCLAFALQAQQFTLRGRVSIHNSQHHAGKIEYVAGAYASAPFTAPVDTDEDGFFQLEFVGLDSNTEVQITIEKAGMEVVNASELQRVLIGQKTLLRVYLAPKGQLARVQTELYNVGKKAFHARCGTMLARLRASEAERKAAIAELEESLGQQIASHLEAEEHFKSRIKELEKRLPALALELAAANLDFASGVYRKAHEHYLKGEIEKANTLLAGAKMAESEKYLLATISRDSASRLYQKAYELYQKGEIEKALEVLDDNEMEALYIQNITAIAQARDQMARNKEVIASQERKIRQAVEGYKLKARSHYLLFEYRHAAQAYEKAIRLLEGSKENK